MEEKSTKSVTLDALVIFGKKLGFESKNEWLQAIARNFGEGVSFFDEPLVGGTQRKREFIKKAVEERDERERAKKEKGGK